MMQGIPSSVIPIPGSNSLRAIGDPPSTTTSPNPPSTAPNAVTSPNATGASGGARPRRPRSRRDRDKRFTCDVEGCDKTYTRAEHLTRHQLNRKFPLSAPFPPATPSPCVDNLCRSGSLQVRLSGRPSMWQEVRSRRLAHPP